jgi:hypothetical protein
LVDTYEALQTRLDVPPSACRESARFLYAGTPVLNRKVVTKPGDKYSNLPLYKTTGLTQYPYYFGGTGYVVSCQLARTITRPAAADQPPLQFWPLEDATMSLWLLPYNITRLSLPQRVEINSARDVFTKANLSSRSAAGQRATFRTKLDVCDRPVWAVHRLYPRQMKLMNQRLSQCAQSAEVRRTVLELLAARSSQTNPPRGGTGMPPGAHGVVDLAAARPADSPTRQNLSTVRKVFLDIGSRDGHAIEAFAREHPHDFLQYEVHAFEADPRHASKMDRFLQRHPTWPNIHVHLPVAAWVEDGTRPAPAEGRAVGRAGGAPDDLPQAKGRASQVQTIDLAAWIRREMGANIPAGADGRSSLDLRGRLDVGGDEFELMPHLLRTGVFGLFTELDVAWHDGRREDMWLWPAQYEGVLKALDIRHSQAHQSQSASRGWIRWGTNAAARRGGGLSPGRAGTVAERRASKKGMGEHAGFPKGRSMRFMP